MARDFVVSFQGNIGNLREWSAAINGAAAQAATAVEKANLAMANSAVTGGVQGYLKDFAGVPGNYIANVSTTFDALSNQIKTSMTIANKYISDYQILVDKATGKHVVEPLFSTSYIANIDRATGAVDRFIAATQAVAPVNNERLRLTQITRQEQSTLLDQIDTNKTRQNLENAFLKNAPKSVTFPVLQPEDWALPADAQNSKILERTTSLEGAMTLSANRQREIVGNYTTKLAALEADIASKEAAYLTATTSQKKSAITRQKNALIDQVSQLTQSTKNELAGWTKYESDARAAFESTPTVLGARERIKTIQTETAQLHTAYEAAGTKLEADLQNFYRSTSFVAQTPTGPQTINPAALIAEQESQLLRNTVPAETQNLLKNQQLRNILAQSGLGGGAPFGTDQFAINYGEQGAQLKAGATDISTGVTHLTASFSQLDATGKRIPGTFSTINLAMDSTGTIIDRVGRSVQAFGQQDLARMLGIPVIDTKAAQSELQALANQSNQTANQVVQGYKVMQNAQGQFQAVPIMGTAEKGFQPTLLNLNSYLSEAEKTGGHVQERILAIDKAAANTRAQLLNSLQMSLGEQAKIGDELWQKFSTIREGAAFTPTGAFTQGTGPLLIDMEKQAQELRVTQAERVASLRSEIQRTLAVGGPTALPQVAQLNAELQSAISGQDIAALEARIQTVKQVYGQLVDGPKLAAEQLRQVDAQIRAELANIATRTDTLKTRAIFGGAAPLGTMSPVASALQESLKNQIIPPDFYQLLQQSPQLRKQLIGAGLGGGAQFGTVEFFSNFEKQGAKVGRVVEDISTGLRTFSISFEQLGTAGERVAGSWKTMNGTIGQTGEVIQQMPRRMSGLRGALSQTVRDFQKVIEWTVATSLVFGGLGLAVQQIRGLNELNSNLERFAITAQLSSKQAQEQFKNLAAIAYETATPLNELVKAADDIALATRQAGQSTQDWQKDIQSLTYAVGLLTNIAGIDTVKATDLLTATFKQLSIAPNEVINVLNKVTAAAGGQSTAIADIIQAVGTVSEAAKAAGLSVDQIVASVQVLSQVTSKTPADVATAFKNLFGAINSPASVKTLKEFGIQVRDAEGNLRPFLTIYREIGQAISSGVIPAGRVQDVLRAISGGPRRAPDAAALLGNLDKIGDAETRAFNASNEALIANGRLLDTNSAKITQLQVAFDAAIFQKFGNTLQDAIGAVTDALTLLLKIFNSIPTGVYTVLAGWAAMTVAFKLAVAGGSSLIKTLSGIVTELSQLAGIAPKAATGIAAVGTASADASAAAAGGAGLRGLGFSGGIAGAGAGADAAVGTTLAQRLLGSKGLSRGVAGRLGVAGAVGAGIGGLSSGGDLAGILGGLASGIGIGLLSVPEPTGFTKLAGAGLLAAGTIGPMLFPSNNSPEVQRDRISSAEQILSLTQQYQDASKTVTDLTQKQRELGQQFIAAKRTYTGTADEVTQLNSIWQSYLNTTTDLTDALKQQKEAMTELNKATPSDQGLRTRLQIAQRGGYSPDSKAMQDLIAEATNTFFKERYPNYVPLDQQNFALQPFTQPLALPDTGSLIAQRMSKGGIQKYNLEDVQKNFNKITDLISADGSKLTVSFVKSRDSINILTEALGKYADTLDASDPKTQKIIGLMNDLAASADSVAQSDIFNKIADIRISTLLDLGPKAGGITQEQADAARANEQLISDLTKRASELPPTIRGEGQVYANPDVEAILKQADSLRNLNAKGNQSFIGFGKIQVGDFDKYINMLGLLKNSEISLNDLTDADKAALLEKQGYMVNYTKSVQDATSALQDLIAANKYELQQGSNKNVASLSESLRQNELDFATGKIDAKQFNLVEDQLKALLRLNARLKTSFKDLDQPSLRELEKQFRRIPGLGDAATLSMSDFIARLIDVAKSNGATATQIDALTIAVMNLKNGLDSLTGTYQANVLIRPLLAGDTQSEALGQYSAAAAAANNPANIGSVLANANQALINAANQLAIEALLKPKKTPINAGAGSGTKATLDVSSLDIPKELIDLGPKMLGIDVNQAIKDARALQHKIPGEDKEAKNDIVALLNGVKLYENVRGVKEEYLRKALDNLANIEKQRLDQETKADMISRIRIGSGSFAALANVPMNSQTGVSLGGPQGPININLNINGQVLTPAQMDAIAQRIIAGIKLRA